MKCIACKGIMGPSKKSRSATKNGVAGAALQKAVADKYWKMRAGNNKSSKKNRDKTRERLRSKEAEEAELERKREVLQAQHDELQEEITELKKQLYRIFTNGLYCIILRGAQMNKSNKN